MGSQKTGSRGLREKKAISVTLLTTLVLAAGAAHSCFCVFLPREFGAVFVPLNVYFVVTLVDTLVRLIFCNPGFLERHGAAGAQIYQSDEQMCQVCGVAKPKFTHHCYKCGKCVSLYDHHCNVFANCFGARSVGYIFKFLLLTGLFLLLSSAELLAADFLNFRRTLHGWGKFWAIYCAILSVYELVGGPVLVALAFRLCSNQIFRGIGQIERRNGLDSNGKSREHNFRVIFGRKWLLALLLPGWTAQYCLAE